MRVSEILRLFVKHMKVGQTLTKTRGGWALASPGGSQRCEGCPYRAAYAKTWREGAGKESDGQE
jgi:hypothetical protein